VALLSPPPLPSTRFNPGFGLMPGMDFNGGGSGWLRGAIAARGGAAPGAPGSSDPMASTQVQPGPLTRSTPPQGGRYGDVNLPQDFGYGYDPRDPLSASRASAAGPFNRTSAEEPYGAGAYGLPEAFAGWSGPSRNALLNAMVFSKQQQPAIDLYRGQMDTDWSKVLMDQQSDLISTASADASRQRSGALARAGYGGGGAVSPFQASQLQAEAMARAGQLGVAARASVLQGQQMKAEAGRNYLNSIAQNLQAFLTPAQLETSRQARVPGTSGVNYIGPAIQAAGSVLGGFAAG